MSTLLKLSLFVSLIGLSACALIRPKGPNYKIEFEESDEPCYEDFDYEWKDYNCVTKRNYRRAFYTEGLSTIWKYYKPHIKSEIRMSARDRSYGVPIGTSKWGGAPDIPVGSEWPASHLNAPYKLLTQINLKELHSIKHEDNLLPKTGMLYFAYATDADSCQWYYRTDCFKVFYVATEKKELVRQPLQLKNRFRATAVEFKQAYGFQKENDIEIKEYNSSAEECAYESGRLWEPITDIIQPAGRMTKMFGYLNDIQGDMTPNCAKDLGGKVDDWILLLQLDSQPESYMMWHDVGRIYFLIKRSDLESLNFDNLCIDLDGH